ncbi:MULTISPECIES: aldehyde dehydrogenase family protein [unclassified Helicobacter]|uniref:aldehyde dehydrogenase family protein n=1 Tax=unclassified Helicobacter TaxID=2593540 RepID=UPI000CF1270E|nr:MULTISPECIES: aldehyde dehydrogenase family protein [unclassified Helicobacter]
MQKEISSIILRQKEFFYSHKTLSKSARLQALDSILESIKYHEEQILQALYLDLNKSKEEGFMSEIAQVYKEIKSARKWVKRYTTPKSVKSPLSHLGGKSKIYYEPYGVVLIISPWNYPINLSLIPLVGAIASGNCVILKPSEYSQHSSNILEKIIARAFLKDFVCVLQGGKEVGEYLLQQKFDYIFFTGSESVGRIVMQEAAKNLTPITLELGGKNPCIVEDYKNVQIITRKIAWGKWLNSGQTCIAPDLLLIQQDLKECVVENLKQNIINLYTNDQKNHHQNQEINQSIINSKDYCKIISPRHFQRLLDLLQELKEIKEEGRIIFGGHIDQKALKISPTLVDFGLIEHLLETLGDQSIFQVRSKDNKNPKLKLLQLKLLQEEIFGPILPILTYKNLDECISFIQKFEKPLALYLFSDAKEKQDQVVQTISFGNGCINDCIAQVANNNLPFGGVGNSGIGSYHGIFSAETFCRKKGIFKGSSSFDIHLRYPPYSKKTFGLERIKIFRWLLG